jgi:hypothetical protein
VGIEKAVGVKEVKSIQDIGHFKRDGHGFQRRSEPSYTLAATSG